MRNKLAVVLSVILLFILSTAGIASADIKSSLDTSQSAMEAVYHEPEVQFNLNDFILPEGKEFIPSGTAEFKKSSGDLAQPKEGLPNSEALKSINAPSFSSYQWDFPLTSGTINCMVEDNYGGIWFGTSSSGVRYLLNDEWYNFTTYNTSGYLRSNTILSAAYDQANNIVYFGTDNGLFYIMLPSVSFGNLYFNTSNKNCIWSVAIDSDGQIWMGSKDGVRYTYRTDQSSFYLNTSNSSLPANEVYAIAIDKTASISNDYRYYFGTYGGGIARYNYAGYYDMNIINTANDSKLRSNTIYTLAFDPGGMLWAGTFGGLYGNNFKGKKACSYYIDNDNLNKISSIAVCSDQYLWMGTYGGGVIHKACDFSTTEEFTATNSQLPTNHINSVLIDSQGSKWFGTQSNGVARLKTVTSVLTTVTVSGSIPQLTVGGSDFDLSGLTVTGKDQYGNYYDLSGMTKTWSIASGSSYASIANGKLRPVAAGSGSVKVTVNGVASNAVSFTVAKPAPVLTTVTVTGSIPTLQVGGSDYDLSGLTVTGKDQYGESYNISGLTKTWSVSNGGAYASIVSGKLHPVAAGSGSVKVTVNGVASNAVSFTVVKPAPVLTTVTVTGSIPTLEVGGSDYDLSGLTVTGKDQYGDPCNISGLTKTWSVSSGSAYACIVNGKLHAIAAGSGSVTATVNGVTSNALSFTITAAGLKVSSTVPADGSVEVGINTEVSVTFDSDIDLLNAAGISINGTAVGDSNIAVSGNKLTISHANFNYSTQYTVALAAGSVKSVVSGAENTTYNWRFTTVSEPPQPATIALVPQSGNFGVNELINAKIKINEQITNLSAVEMHLSFDPVLYEVTAAGKGASLNEDWVSINKNIDNKNGKIDLAFGILDNTSMVSGSNLEVGTLTIKAKAEGTGTVGFDFDQANNRNTFYQVKVNNYSIDQPFTGSINASYTVSLNGKISGQIQLAPVKGDLSGYDVKLVELAQSVKTDSSGNYLFDCVAPGTYTVEIKINGYTPATYQNVTVTGGSTKVLPAVTLLAGDADGDGKINLTDFGKLANAYGSLTGNINYDPCADSNADGKVNLSDFGMLAYNYGKILVMPALLVGNNGVEGLGF